MSEAGQVFSRGSSARPPRLYTIADSDALGPAAVPAAVDAMASAGVRWIQLRLKKVEDRRRWQIAQECTRRLLGSGVRLWIDDRPDLTCLLALEPETGGVGSVAAGTDGAGPSESERARAGAHGVGLGVHVGQKDLPPEAVRKIVGQEVLIGHSCHDVGQVRAADQDPAVDVVAIGPVFETRSKDQPDPTVGLAGVAEARKSTRKPLVAIGGIDADNARSVLTAGADSVVMLGAACRGDVKANCRRLTALLEDVQ